MDQGGDRTFIYKYIYIYTYTPFCMYVDISVHTHIYIYSKYTHLPLVFCTSCPLAVGTSVSKVGSRYILGFVCFILGFFCFPPWLQNSAIYGMFSRNVLILR